MNAMSSLTYLKSQYCIKYDKGNCWDTEVAKSFFKTLKCGLINGNTPILQADVVADILQYGT